MLSEPMREKLTQRKRGNMRDFKDKRFRTDFGDKHVFSEGRRNESFAEEVLAAKLMLAY